MAGALYGWTLKFELEGPAVLKNACLEATLVHLRVLIEFLSGRRRNGNRHWNANDIQPANFIPSWKAADRLDGYLDLADKHVAHMSRERARSSAPRNWALQRMIKEVLFELERSADDAARAGDLQLQMGVKIAVAHARALASCPPEDWLVELPTLPPGSGLVGGTTTEIGGSDAPTS
jgi:hypothetical protein